MGVDVHGDLSSFSLAKMRMRATLTALLSAYYRRMRATLTALHSANGRPDAIDSTQDFMKR